MSAQSIGYNTLYFELACPHCGSLVRSGIGFRAGVVNGLTYHVGEKLTWEGPNLRPAVRPPSGFLKTIGYFNCDNPRCETWQDCFPAVQEAIITVKKDVIVDVQPTVYKPGEQSFEIIEPPGMY